MPYRKSPLVTGEIYHVFNRSIAHQPIFLSKRDYKRITQLIFYYRYYKPSVRYSYFNRMSYEKQQLYITNLRNNKPMVDILTYCLMPNHFHFLLKASTDNAISDFMRNLQNSYSKYFNTKTNRSGSLFQAMFKAVHIETEEQLMHVSRYIHLNPITSAIISVEALDTYPWSSFKDYITESEIPLFVNKSNILELFPSSREYKSFVYNQIDYQKTLHKIKYLILE